MRPGQQNPRAFDGKPIRVRGTLNVHFEDFSLGLGNCDTRQGIWLAFGGDVPGISCLHGERFLPDVPL